MKKTWILPAVVALALPGNVYGQGEAKVDPKSTPPKATPGAAQAGELETRVAALEKQIAALNKSIEALNQKLDDGNIEPKLPKPDGSDEGTERKAMRPVTNGGGSAGDSSNGRLMITNNSGCDQYLYINCRLWRVVSGKSFAEVPRGNVIVQRPGGAAQTLSSWQTESDGTHVVHYTYPPSTTVTVLSPVFWP